MNEGSKIDYVLGILKRVTAIVKVAPFAYAIIFTVAMFCYLFTSDDFASTLDRLFYVSPLVIAFEVALSYSLKFCIWHRLQCALPMLPTATAYVDDFVFKYTYLGAYANVILITAVFVFSLFNAYKTFIKQ